MKKIILNATIFTIIFCAGILATYRVIRARTWWGAIEAQTGDILTATKRNEVVWMTADAWTVQSSNYISAPSSRTNIPWMSQTITLKRAAHVQISASWQQWQPSSSWAASYNIYIDWTQYGWASERTSITYANNIDSWAVSYWINLAAWDHTVSIQTVNNSWTPTICAGGGTSPSHVPCTMFIQAFYN